MRIGAIFLTLVVAGCGLVRLAQPAPPPHEIERRKDATDMANYVSAHLASKIRDRASAAIYYTRVARAAPMDGDLLEKAVWANVIAGSLDRAIALAEKAPPETRKDAPGAVLVRAVGLIADRDWGAAHTELALVSAKTVEEVAAAARLLAVWTDIATKSEATKREEVRNGQNPFSTLSRTASLANMALISLAEGHDEDALAALENSWKLGMRHAPLVREYFRLLRARGRDEDARNLAKNFRMTLTDGPVAARMAADPSYDHGPLVAPGDQRAGAAIGLSVMAWEYLRGMALDHAVAYARLALFLDPRLDGTRLILADALAASDQSDSALEVLAGMTDADTYRSAIESRRVLLLHDLERGEAAIAAADAALDTELDRSGQYKLARFFLVIELYDRAERVLDDIIAADAALGARDWQMVFARARALEQQKTRWAETEAELRDALRLRPDKPEILNYLGYSLIDRGEKIDEGLTLIKRALTKSPRAGHIIDSLGWAYYRLRRFRQAVIHLEDAVALVPIDPVINSHLGDAYWRIGRFRDARTQWRRAQSYAPDAGLSAELHLKLTGGLK